MVLPQKFLLQRIPIPTNALLPFQEQLSQVLDAMFERKVQPQEHVIDQGDDGDNFYVVER